MSAPPKRRFQLSLLNLLLLLTIGALAFGLMRAHERNRELMAENARVVADAETVEQENLALRAELGVITVTDPTKFHAMQLASENELEWKWRIYMPEGAQYQLTSKGMSVSRRGPSSSGSSQGGEIESGQQTVTFRIFKNPEEEYWRKELRTKTSKQGGSISADVGEWPGRSSRLGTKFGSGKAKAVDLGEPIKLFDLLLEGVQSDRDAEPWPRKPSVSAEVTLVPLGWEPPSEE